MFDHRFVQIGQQSGYLDLTVCELTAADTILNQSWKSVIRTNDKFWIHLQNDDCFVGVLYLFQEPDKFEFGFLSNGLKIYFGKQNDLYNKVIFIQSKDDPLYFIFLVQLLPANVTPDNTIMKLGKCFGHDFVYLFVYEFVLVVAQHLLELWVAVGDCAQRHLVCLYADVGQVFVLTHFYKVPWILLELFSFLYVLLGLSVPLPGLGEALDVDSHVHEELNVAFQGYLVVREYLVYFVVVHVNQLL